MSNSETLSKAFRESLGLDESVDLSEVVYGQIEEWDSIAHMQLVAGIESAFDIMMDTDDVIKMSSFTIAREILTRQYDVNFDA